MISHNYKTSKSVVTSLDIFLNNKCVGHRGLYFGN